MWNREILFLGDGTVLVECGPMRMFIDASREGIPQPDLCREAAERAVDFLGDVARVKDSLKSPALISEEPAVGTLAHTMWVAARLIGDPDLTPMAAVAGTIAGATADFLEDQGMTRVVVNNGGDLALRLKGEEQVYIGIRPRVDDKALSHRLLITSETGIGGVATSGLGGRSFTRGVASAATVLAADTACADAAATALGNATYVSADSVVRSPAESLYPDTDLDGLEVTTWVGELPPWALGRALEQGIGKAEDLVERGIIWGACFTVQGRMRSTKRLANHLEPLARCPVDGGAV